MHSNVYIIIVTFNGGKWVRRCLQSALDSDIPVKVLVIDNGSKDNTLEVLKEFPMEKFDLIETGKNLGFGKANNIGIEHALSEDAEFIYLLNQDAYINADTISSLIKVYKEYPQYGVLSPMQMSLNPKKLDANFLHNCSPDKCPGFLNDLFVSSLKEVYSVDFVMAAHWFIPSSIFREIGLFSPLFQHYGEDHDFLNRLHYHGYYSGICPFVKGIHDREFRIDTNDRKIKFLYLRYLVDISNVNSNLRTRIINYTEFIIKTGRNVIRFKSFLPIRYFFKLTMEFTKISKHINKYK